jgi:hypothetical protein
MYGMADDKRNQDKLNNEDTGQMGGQPSQSGQKGGQSQTGYKDTDNGMANDPTRDRDSSLSDEDL